MSRFSIEFSRDSAISLFPRTSSVIWLSKNEVASLLKSIELALNNPDFVVSEQLVSCFFDSISAGDSWVAYEDVYYPLKALVEQLCRN